MPFALVSFLFLFALCAIKIFWTIWESDQWMCDRDSSIVVCDSLDVDREGLIVIDDSSIDVYERSNIVSASL
ncbi:MULTISPECIES: hypothetical protein [Leptolyngbya]|uniref:hypothetical protein n=1 Tax=Leptolyngbya TaxID=47251 RepID=UPI0003619099|nr:MULTISPECIES: hypothetical protein [Leptolyngbya]MBD2377385.1 hypothetical protein [Leptolyngbya sp. FACHB-238]MBD2408261.1 hypothetical protein [Leptolyngbya sp. FACHB-402]ULP27801.1 hypothetical protein MCP04_17375 [Leptolyngbya boryana IU 594]